MNIQVIGSGDIWSKCNSASYLIDNCILIDVPNGTYKNLCRLNINPRSIDNILLTHFHGDHYFDMPFMLLGKLKSDDKCINIYGGKNGLSKIKEITKLAFPFSYFRIFLELKVKYCIKDSFRVGEYNIDKILVDHGNMKPAYGYIISKDNIKIGFTGDSCYCDGVKYMASKCDYLICDCTLSSGNNNHMGIDNILKLHDDYKNCHLILSHLDDKTRIKVLKYDDLIVAEDGKKIETCNVRESSKNEEK